jgi:metal-responsive CopG/Arc/MetJ family transcriptional regulator
MMAKVMISIPDDLLARLDQHARRLGQTRSGFLRQLVERELAVDGAARAARVRALLSNLEPHAGDSARFVREQRRAR